MIKQRLKKRLTMLNLSIVVSIRRSVAEFKISLNYASFLNRNLQVHQYTRTKRMHTKETI